MRRRRLDPPPPVTVVGFVEGYQVVVVVVVVGTAYRPNNSRRDTVSPFFLLFPWRRLLARSLRGIRCSRAGFVTPEALKRKRGRLPLLPVSASRRTYTKRLCVRDSSWEIDMKGKGRRRGWIGSREISLSLSRGWQTKRYSFGYPGWDCTKHLF